MIASFILVLPFLLSSYQCDASISRPSQCATPKLSPEKRVLKSSIAVKALVSNTYNDDRFQNAYIAELWILDVYKGADKLATALGLTLASDEDTAKLRDRRVNVSHWGDEKKCWNTLQKQRTYIIVLTSSKKFPVTSSRMTARSRTAPLQARYDEDFGAAIDFSLGTEQSILKALGWNAWMEWGSCSAPCGNGIQTRERSCAQPASPGTCPTYNVEKRTCNTFHCKYIINTLNVSESRYFKPSPAAFQRSPRRPSAWIFKPGSYLLLPFKDAFEKVFPRDFTIFLTVKPFQGSEGVIFSLNGRSSRQEYISLGINSGRLELIHSLPNGSRTIDIPARINDGNWHQLAFSIQGGSSVRTYLDCHWISTQILHDHALTVPTDTDLIIGYMFQGEIEQLVVSEEIFAVSQQCSPTSVPYRDEHLMSKQTSTIFKPMVKSETIAAVEIIDTKDKKVMAWKSEHQSDPKDYLDEEYVYLDTPQADQPMEERLEMKKHLAKLELTEASGGELEDDEEIGSGDFELEWSDWSTCSSTCGPGQQYRLSHCQDNGNLEECISSGLETKQVRACKIRPCSTVKTNDIRAFQNSDDVIEYEIVTRKDVDAIKNRITLDHSKYFTPTHMPKDKPDVQTNLIPHIPNYWVPTNHKNSDVSVKHEGKKCHCQNGGTCVDSSTSTKCRCRKGYTGKFCERPRCRPECKNGGKCSAPDVCSCPEGYTGARCQDAFCYPMCQNGGSCIAPFKCSCPFGVSGNFCQEFSCKPHCENGGLCIGHNTCSCPHGFSGPDCRDKTCTARCENGGLCMMPDNTCKCRDGFYGSRCQKRICQHYIAVREPHRRSYRRLVNVEYDSVCGQEMTVCKKTRPEYRTEIKTVYRTTYKCAEELKKNSRKL